MAGWRDRFYYRNRPLSARTTGMGILDVPVPCRGFDGALAATAVFKIRSCDLPYRSAVHPRAQTYTED